ncbi:MAG: YfhO family protein [Planctomycetes bacterium]|nr:YfhO family protein [Planctomycetota bacterium]
MSQAYVAPSLRQQLQAILLAALCAVAFLRESLWPGRALVPYPPEFYDVYTAQAQAEGRLDVADALRGTTCMGDKYNQSLCWDRVLMDRLRAGEVPLWTRDIGGGASFVPQMAQVWQPINLLLLLMPSEQWYGPWVLIHQVLFGFLCYRFLRRIGCQHLAAQLGVVVAVLGLWTQCKLHHNVILTAALSIWPMLSAVHALLRDGGGTRAIASLAAWTGLSWMSGFAVVSLQASYLTVAFAVFLALGNPKGLRRGPLLRVALGLLLGGVFSLPHMGPVLLATADSARSAAVDKVTLAAVGLEVDHLLTLAWPDLLSWAADRFYTLPDPERIFAEPTRMPWSQLVLLHDPLPGGQTVYNWVETSFAFGLPALACALLALFERARRELVWFFVGAGVLAFLFAAADEPFLTIGMWLPGLAAADLRRLLFVCAIAGTIVAAIGADSILSGPRRWPAWWLLGAIAATSAVAAVWLWRCDPETALVDTTARLLAADSDHPRVQAAQGSVDAIAHWIRNASKPGEAANNRAQLLTTALRALVIAGLAFAALSLRAPGRRLQALLLLTAIELVHAGLGPMQTVSAERVTTAPAVVAPVAAAAEANGVRPRLQRLVPADDPRIGICYPCNLPGFHRLEDTNAYNPLPPARMTEFFRALEPDRAGKRPIAYGAAGVGPFADPASLQHPLADLFGIRFVLTELPIAASPALVERTPPGTGRFRLLERTTTLPRATFVRAIDVIPDKAARLATLGRTDRDPGQRLILESDTVPRPAPGAAANAATVTTVEHRDERVVVSVTTPADGYLRLADPYDPGWRATIDGEPTPLYPADHYLRAVYVPAGSHEVVFTFDAPRVVWPPRIGGAALAMILLLLAWPRRRRS